MRQLEAQKRQQELILRRKNEEVNQAVIKKANLKTRPGLNISSFFPPLLPVCRWRLWGDRWGPCRGRRTGSWARPSSLRKPRPGYHRDGRRRPERALWTERGAPTWATPPIRLQGIWLGRLFFQELPSTEGRRSPEPHGQDQMAVSGETRQWHHHAEDDHLQHGDGHEPPSQGNGGEMSPRK